MISIEEVTRPRIMPVVVIDDESQAWALGRALVEGGMTTIEITLRTPAALPAIRALSSLPGAIVGAGTVTRAEEVDQVVEAGGKFLVGPGLSDAVAERAAAVGVPYIPGAATASEMQHAIDLGFSVVKFFPAEALGGAAALKVLGGPFPDLRFVVTGGMTAERATDYLALANVVAVGGSWMVDRQWIKDGRFDAVTSAARAAIASAA